MPVLLINSRNFIVLLFSVLISGCDDICQQNQLIFRKKEYSFLIKNRRIEQEKITILEGPGPSGFQQIFAEIGMDQVYDNVAIGDSLIKRNGSTNVVTVHDGRRIVHDCSCRKKD